MSKHHTVADLAREFLRPGARGDHHRIERAEAQFAVEAHAAVDRLHAAHAFLRDAAAEALELCGVRLHQPVR